jgi:hypothetical protein
MKLKPLFLVAALAAAFSAHADTFQYRTFAKGVVAPKPGVNLSGDTDFGTVTAGQTQTRTFTLTNTSSEAPLRVLGIAFDGQRLTRAAGGTCPTTFPGTLPANGSCTILGTWAPLAAGTLAPASLAVSHDAPSSSHTLELTGTAIPVPPAYAFTSHTFTNCTATGPFGPSLAQCRTAYSAASAWTADASFFNVVNGIQYWTVPESGNYDIAVNGASGADAYQYSAGAGYGDVGAGFTATLALTKGEVLQLLVGQAGRASPSGNVGGGGGASFVVRGSTPLLIAAGGNGAPYASNRAPSSTAAAGFSTDGIADYSIPAKSFLNGGTGGQSNGKTNPCNGGQEAGPGGFGGGGAGTDCHQYGGGGGGYTGGAVSNSVSYSVVASTPISSTGRGAQGRIVITKK